ncbi:heme o synthase [Candidatus Saccharibacteria bacterium]|nr:heme o synthase [Candidatus Saccharibacteria bacterium]
MRDYYRLTKPGIIYGNLMTAVAGFFFASQLHIYWDFLPMAAGLSLVMASACVFNNFLDRDIDRRMSRTAKRALVSGVIAPRSAIIYACILGAMGLFLLAVYVNWPAYYAAVAAMILYVIVYGVAKRRSVHGTLVGAIPGALPLVIGYLAVSGSFDKRALLLFLIMFFWQMPHFYTIAMFRYKDYKAAGLPVITVRKGMAAAKKQSMIYIVLFAAAASLLWFYEYTGLFYLLGVLAASGYWLWVGLKYYDNLSDEKWGRKMFFTSLKVLMVLSVCLAFGSVLP